MKKILFSMILCIAAPSVLFPQNWGLEWDTAVGVPFRIGVGTGFEDHFGLLVPRQAAQLRMACGYEYDIHSWYGLGPDTKEADESGNEANLLYFNDLYFLFAVEQVLVEGKTELEYEISAGFRNVSRLMVPFEWAGKQLFESGYRTGDSPCMNHSPAFFFEATWIDDVFWTTKGFRLYAEIGLEGGNDFEENTWALYTSKQEMDFWLPMSAEKLFLHFALNGDFILAPIAGETPFFIYPNLDPGSIRSLDHSYFDCCALSARLELISRVFEFDLLCPMSMDFGLFCDAGMLAETITRFQGDKAFITFGGFMELKADFYSFAVSVQVGTAARISYNAAGDRELIPGIYFRID